MHITYMWYIEMYVHMIIYTTTYTICMYIGIYDTTYIDICIYVMQTVENANQIPI